MKFAKYGWLLLAVCLLGVGVFFSQKKGKVDQVDLLEEAKAEAMAQNKPLLLDFYAQWCQPCKLFDRARQEDAEIVEAMEQVLLFKIDCENNNGETLKEAYMVEQYPTFILLLPDGSVQGQWTGYQKRMFLTTLNQHLADIQNI